MRTLLWVVVAAGVAAGCNKGSPKIVDAAPPIDAGPVDAVLGDDAAVDAGATAVGHPGTATVTGAVKASSPNYHLYGTLRSGDGSSASPSYQRRGGVTGATQP
ncbi:MAG: hypothetical protein R3B06_16620 [Kofleriaceae bacterium]